jgi:hypothetical protein
MVSQDSTPSGDVQPAETVIKADEDMKSDAAPGDKEGDLIKSSISL